jgi:hypothetical protein
MVEVSRRVAFDQRDIYVKVGYHSTEENTVHVTLCSNSVH